MDIRIQPGSLGEMAKNLFSLAYHVATAAHEDNPTRFTPALMALVAQIFELQDAMMVECEQEPLHHGPPSGPVIKNFLDARLLNFKLEKTNAV